MSTYSASASIDAGQITVTRPQQSPEPVEQAIDDMIYRLRDAAGEVTRIDLSITVDESAQQPDAEPLPPTDPQTQIAQGEPAPPAEPLPPADTLQTTASTPTEGAASSEQPATDPTAG